MTRHKVVLIPTATGFKIELKRAANDEALIEHIAGAEHFAAFDNDGAGSFVCECGLPWIAGEGCAFLQGARAFAVARISSEGVAL